MTTIGTPLSPHATRALLLGSGELGREVIIALQRLGVETIAVDRYDNAPGQQLAHHARTIAMTDPAQLKALIEAERPDLVLPEIEAIATGALVELEQAGVTRVIPTARAAQLTGQPSLKVVRYKERSDLTRWLAEWRAPTLRVSLPGRPGGGPQLMYLWQP